MDASLGKSPHPNRLVIRSEAKDLMGNVRPHQHEQGTDRAGQVLRSAQDNKRERVGETALHLELKRLALLWAQENGYPICALEVSLPRCRYRADVAAYRPQKTGIGVTVIFECKQSAPDLRRDDCRSPQALTRLESLYRRRQILEKHLRIHYPTLRTGDTLFPEWDAHYFGAIPHRGYARVSRELAALQSQLHDGRKFEKLARYACANLFFLVVPNELLREPEAPLGWGLLIEQGGCLTLHRRPVWHESKDSARLHVLQKIAAAGTRQFRRRLMVDETWRTKAPFSSSSTFLPGSGRAQNPL